MEKLPYIVAIDDLEYNLELFKITLSSLDVKLDCFLSPSEAFKSIKANSPDLILLDINLPEMDGFPVLEVLKKDPITKDIPVIFVTSSESIDDKVKALKMGCVDYITKPFHVTEIIARVNTHLKLNLVFKEMNVLLRESFHELYTPLSLIKSSLALQELEHGQTQYTQNIKAAANTLHSVYEDMYYAIKKEVREYEKDWVQLDSFIETRLKIFKPNMDNRSLTYKINSHVEDPMIHISTTELERLIDNIISNAIKYAIENTQISISIELIHGEYIQLKISNHSKEIKDVKQFFIELYQEDHSTMGLGIGLKIVKNICQKNNINIDVESQNNITSFILRYKESS